MKKRLLIVEVIIKHIPVPAVDIRDESNHSPTNTVLLIAAGPPSLQATRAAPPDPAGVPDSAELSTV